MVLAEVSGEALAWGAAAVFVGIVVVWGWVLIVGTIAIIRDRMRE